MEPWEIMISESQERMVAVVRPQMLDAVRAVCARWELAVHADRRGDRSRRAARALATTSAVGSIPAPLLTDECPRYEVEQAKPDAWPAGAEAAERGEPRRQDVDLRAVRPARRLAHRAPARARRRRAAAAAVAARARRRRCRGRGPARATRSRAGVQAVLGAARNVACAGGEPIGLTDCLNFGNPEKPEIAYELAQAIEGIAQRRGGARDPGRLRERVALQRHRRPLDPADAGRRLRRARARRAARARAAGSRATSCCSRRRPERRLAAEAALIRFLWKAAPLLSLCHDVGLRRARARARRGGALERPRGGRRAAAEPAHGAAILATPRDDVANLGSQGLRRDRPRCGRHVRRLRRLRARPRRLAAHVLRALLAAASRPGVGGDRRLGARAADGAPRPRPRHAGVRRAEAPRPARRRSRSATRATRRQARRSGRTRSRSCSTAARARSRSGTTATSSTRRRCATSCTATASRCARPPTAR